MVLRVSIIFYITSIIYGPLSNLLWRLMDIFCYFDVLVMKKEGSLRTTVYRKPTHTGRYLQHMSDYPMSVKQGGIHGLFHRACKLCHNEQDNWTELELVKKELATVLILGTLWIHLSTRNPDIGRRITMTINLCVCEIAIPYIRGISENFKRTGERFNIKTVFKATLANFFRKTKPNIDTLDRSQCIYRIACECGTEYIGKTGRPLNTRIRQHKYNLREGHFDKSKLASHAFEEGHKIDWINTIILQSQPNTIHRKYKEAAYMLRSNDPISQSSLDISRIWFPLTDKELHK
ncbi:hypothetical protein Cfor_02438 [Coptotermes formosanus]|uniref:Helix-turn-helix domain-containing protein n=1 Tax=Coptotermes formosanus TaxID=36987 RepID=A0A6L2PMZ2_COPFO|nr:hypothetical protein Cfor_02438 [Coptotermes formosanus]